MPTRSLRRLAAVVALLTSLAAVPPAMAQEPAGSAEASEAFLRELQQAVAEDDRSAVAGLMAYPVTVFVAELRIPIADASALQEHFETIFTDGFRAIVAEARTPEAGGAQSPSPLTRSDDGLTLTLGGILEATWIPPSRGGGPPANGAYRISRITVPAGTPPARVRSAPREPRRVGLRAGQRPTRLSGTLTPEGRDAYVVAVGRGQLLDVRIQRVRGREILLWIRNAETGEPPDDRAADGVRAWVGRVPAQADYLIEVARGEPSPAPALPYELSLGIR